MASGDPTPTTQTGIPADAGPALDEHARRELHAAEQKAAAADRGQRNWSWLNRPITLWLLQHGCRRGPRLHLQPVLGLSRQPRDRLVTLRPSVPRAGVACRRHLWPHVADNVQAGTYLLILDPDRHFLFTEFKAGCRTSWWLKSNSCCASGIHPMLPKSRQRPQGVPDPKSKAVPSAVPLNEPGLTTSGPSLNLCSSC